MPKIEIDYSNTIIYKISCKDPLIKDIYVGHTTNFVQRKHAHKQACNNIKSSCYNLKLYKTIRENGNWGNWDMTIIQFYNCKDLSEARQKEQQHFKDLNATLNNIEPYILKVNQVTTSPHLEPKNIQNYNIISIIDKQYKFNCALCNYNSKKNSEWQKHILTGKHSKRQEAANVLFAKQQKKIQCEICKKEYINRSGLWRHKKTCFSIQPDDKKISEKSPEKSPEPPTANLVTEKNTENEIIKMLIQENKEFKNLILELIKKDNLNITNNTNNSHNKTFNLQFFLNEECKDALNISEFVSSIKVELEDLEATGRLGYVEGVSRIMNKNLKELDVNKRPIHCSDLKREILYIKNDDQWIKEEETKPILKKAIKQVAYENIKQINEWKKKYPDCTDSESRKNDLYLKIVGNSMSGLTTEEQLKNYEKIVSRVAKEAIIDK
jgi:hypothetical protein